MIAPKSHRIKVSNLVLVLLDRERLRNLEKQYKAQYEHDIDMFDKQYERYLTLCKNMKKEIKEKKEFICVDNILYEIEKLEKLQLNQLKQHYIKSQIDAVMKDLQYQFIQSRKKDRGINKLYQMDEKCGININLFNQNMIMEVVTIGENINMVRKQEQFYKIYSVIIKELRKRGVILF